MSTIKDVAALAGVSVATVSIIVNGKAAERKISIATQSKVAAAIKTLNYRPNVSAKKLRNSSHKEYTIGVYWASDFRAHFLARIISGIQGEFLKYEYPINIVICPYKNDYLHVEKGLQTDTAFNAAIIANMSPSDMKYLHSSALKIPIVLFNRYSEKYNSVTIDNYEAGKKAALHFITKGITDIGVILHKRSYLAMSIRNHGFIDACRKNNIHIPAHNIITTESTLAGGVQAAEKLLAHNHLPQGIFCDSDALAQGMLHVFNKKKIIIPDDVEIIAIGMSSPDTSKYSTPSLSVVELPMERMAAECVRLIVDVLEHRIEQPSHVLYDSELILRESSR